jgi:acylphosphatase
MIAFPVGWPILRFAMSATNEGSEYRAVRVLVTGRVQGVGYRAWVERTAIALGLKGWVRNKRSGAVEALFAGEAGRVGEMIGRCHDGPRAAAVAEVTVIEEGGIPPSSFVVLPTARN